MTAATKAHKDDVLMQMFSEHILKEWLGWRGSGVLDLCHAFEVFALHVRQGWPVTEDASLNFSRVVQVLDKLSRPGLSDPYSTPLDILSAALARRTGSIYEQGRWCSWGFCSQGFRGYYSAQLLVIMWACIEVGSSAERLHAGASSCVLTAFCLHPRATRKGRTRTQWLQPRAQRRPRACTTELWIYA